MSQQYGTPAFPIRGNLFYGNAGQILCRREIIFILFFIFRFRSVFLGCLCCFSRRLGETAGTSMWSTVWYRLSFSWKQSNLVSYRTFDSKVFLVKYLTSFFLHFYSLCVIKRLWHLFVFLIIALYLGLTVERKRNYVSLIGIIVLILLGTIGKWTLIIRRTWIDRSLIWDWFI